MDIQFPEILFQIINFGVVVGALSYLMYKPVKKILDDRSAKVEEAQKAAELTLAEKRQIDETKKKAQKEAEKEAAQILASAREAAEKMEKELLANTNKKVKNELERQYKEWESEKANLMKKMKADFAREVTNLTEKIVGSALDSKVLSKQLDQNIDDVLERI